MPLRFSAGEGVDWNYAITELLDKQGIDLRMDMERRLVELEEQFRREKEEAENVFEMQKKVTSCCC